MSCPSYDLTTSRTSGTCGTSGRTASSTQHCFPRRKAEHRMRLDLAARCTALSGQGSRPRGTDAETRRSLPRQDPSCRFRGKTCQDTTLLHATSCALLLELGGACTG